jgi:hypothetical protein
MFSSFIEHTVILADAGHLHEHLDSIQVGSHLRKRDGLLRKLLDNPVQVLLFLRHGMAPFVILPPDCSLKADDSEGGIDWLRI